MFQRSLHVGVSVFRFKFVFKGLDLGLCWSILYAKENTKGCEGKNQCLNQKGDKREIRGSKL